MCETSRAARSCSALRARIANGDLAPGTHLPSELTLSQETGLNRSTVRRSIELFRAEGLIVVRHPHGTFVRERGELEVVEISEGSVLARMPTPDERRRFAIDEGVPLLEIVERNHIYPAARTVLKVTPPTIFD